MTRIRKQQATETSDHATQKSFRLYYEQDELLIDWLAEYAKRYKQTDLIRLALYTLSGLDMPAELAELLPAQQPASNQTPDQIPQPDSASDQIERLFSELDHQRQQASEQMETLYQELADEKRRASQQLDTMIAELAALRQAIHLPPEAPGNIVSSGIDMSRPRKRLPGGTATSELSELPDELSEVDQIRLAKIMAASIKRAQPGRKRVE